MKRFVAACIASALVAGRVFAAEPECEVPDSLLAADGDLDRVAAAVSKQNHLHIVAIGSASSLLSGPAGPQTSYPARFEAALHKRLPPVEITLKTYSRARQVASEMAKEFPKILADDKPDLVIWQTGTADAIQGVEPEEFRAVLDEGVGVLQDGGADAILMNMQYSPRTESVIAVGPYADNMRWVAQERGVPLFDRRAIMQYWNEAGTFDLNVATKSPAMAQQVHECVGRALAALVIEAAHLDVGEEKAPH
jgi:hypothetical protein